MEILRREIGIAGLDNQMTRHRVGQLPDRRALERREFPPPPLGSADENAAVGWSCSNVIKRLIAFILETNNYLAASLLV